MAFGTDARAADIAFDGSDQLSQAVADGMVNSFGFLFDHHFYEGAEGRGKRSIALSGEASVIKAPASLFTAFSALGLSLTADSLPFIPALKAHLDVGVTDRFDVNASGFYLPAIGSIPGLLMVGGGFKYSVFVPEEGPVVALRLSYNVMSLSMSMSSTAITSTTASWFPALLVGRKFSVFEPYLGGGYQINYGRFQTVTTLADTPVAGTNLVITAAKNAAVAGGFNAFVGLKLDVYFQMVIEGGYSQAGAAYFGTKIGIGF